MNKFIYILLLIVIILLLLFVNNSYQESFVPKGIKKAYRPIERNIRTKYEGFYNKTSTNVSNLFRKFGIL